MTLKNIIDLTSGIGTLILSILAFCFSIYAYRKISFKTDFRKKQLDTIYELIELLQDTIIHVSSHRIHDNKPISSGTMFRFFRLNSSKINYQEFVRTQILLVTQTPERDLEFIKFSEHPYMVPEIAKIIRDFIAYTNEPVDLKRFKSFTVLGGTGVLDFAGEHYQITDNSVYESFETFCNKCIQLDNAIQKWLKKIGIDNFNKKQIIE